MAKKYTKLLSLALVLVLVFSLMPITGMADAGGNNPKNSIIIHDGKDSSSLKNLTSCSNNGTVTLNIADTNYIFTFKGSKFTYDRSGQETLENLNNKTVTITVSGVEYTIALAPHGEGNSADEGTEATDNYWITSITSNANPDIPNPEPPVTPDTKNIPVKFYVLNPKVAIPADGADMGVGNYYPSAPKGSAYNYADGISGGSLTDNGWAAITNTEGKIVIGNQTTDTVQDKVNNPQNWGELATKFGLTGTYGEGYKIVPYVIKVQSANGDIKGQDSNGKDADIHVDCYVSGVEVTVTYHSNFANDEATVDIATTGKSYTVLGYNGENGAGLPAREGYNFAGWSTTPNGAVEYAVGNTIDPLKTSTDLYAVWQTYTISINLNTKDLGDIGYTTAATVSVNDSTPSGAAAKLSDTLNKIGFSGVSFFDRPGVGTQTGKKPDYSIAKPGYIGLISSGKEYGVVSGYSLNGANPTTGSYDKLKNAAAEALGSKDTATLDYYFDQIVHFGVYGLDGKLLAENSSASNIFTTNSNVSVFVPKTLANIGTLVFKGWKVNDNDYTVNGETGDTVLIKGFPLLTKAAAKVIIDNGVNQLWFNFVPVAEDTSTPTNPGTPVEPVVPVLPVTPADPGTTIPDTDTPTTDKPATDPTDPGNADIPDDDTPKADAPADAAQQVTGDDLVLWIVLAVGSAVALTAIIVIDVKRKNGSRG